MSSIHHLRTLFALAGASMTCLASTMALAAGGLGLIEMGTRDLGFAGAGIAARAEDASTAFTNPAGMTRIKGSDAVLGAQLLYGDVQFSPDGRTTVTGNDGGNPVGWLPGGSAFYVYSLSPDVKLGFSMAGNFGLAEEFDEGFVGRYYVQKSALMGLTFMPSVAWRVNDKLSLGAGLNAMYGYLNAEVKVNNVLPIGIGDGSLKLKDNRWGFGATLGMLYEPAPGTRLGATYTSKIKLDFKATPKFSNLGTIGGILQAAGLGTNDLGLGITVPQAVMTSFYHELGPDSPWAVLGNIGWQEWSKFGKVDVSVSAATPTSLTTQSKYKDTWHAALGAQYKYSPAWLLTGGIAYDSGMVADADRAVALPLGATWAFAAGARYKVRPDYDVSFGYEYKRAGDLPVNQNRGPLAGTVAGEYRNTGLHFFGATFHWSY